MHVDLKEDSTLSSHCAADYWSVNSGWDFRILAISPGLGRFGQIPRHFARVLSNSRTPAVRKYRLLMAASLNYLRGKHFRPLLLITA